MIYKWLFAVIFVVSYLVLQASESAPITPVKQKAGFWCRGSDSESSSACSSTQPSPSSGVSSLFNSPAKCPPDSECFLDMDKNKRQKLISSLATLLLDSHVLNSDVLQKEYNKFLQEIFKKHPFSNINAYNADLYNLDAMIFLNMYVAAVKQKSFSVNHIAFPIFSFAHMISPNGCEG